MDFALTDEQRALDASVRDFLRDRFGPEQVRAVYDDPTGDGSPAQLWASMAEYGWLAITVPEQYDGLGLGLLDAQVVARALGAGSIPGPWLVSVLATEAIGLAGSDEQQAAWLPRLAAGEVVGTVALEAGLAVAGGNVSGTLRRVEYGALADVLVATDDSGGLVLIELRGDGASTRSIEQYDRTTRLAEVVLDGAPAAPLPRGEDVLAELTRRAAVLAAADLVGIARESLTRTVAYDSERVQFGHPVGSFQALKHVLADLHVGVTMAEHAVLYAAHALDVGLPDAELAVAVAKSKASATAKDVTRAMIQFHGGIGFTWEHNAHFYFKRAKRMAASYGDAAQHRERIAALVLGHRTAPPAA